MGKQSHSAFSIEKATVAVAYLAKETGETLYPVMKLIYLAEKLHLERYGRLITGDTYVAMAKGPVPSATYDLMKFLRGAREYFDGGEFARELMSLDSHSHQFHVKKDVDLSYLSESDVECLAHMVSTWRQLGGPAITRLSHDDAWKAATANSAMSVGAIAAQCDAGAALIQHLSDRFPGAAKS